MYATTTPAPIHNLVTALTDEALSTAYAYISLACAATELPTPTNPVEHALAALADTDDRAARSLVCDWVTDEILRRLGDDLFDLWLLAFGHDGNPLPAHLFLQARHLLPTLPPRTA